MERETQTGPTAGILYLSAAAVAACAITAAEMNAAVEAAFLAASRQQAETRPAMTIPAADRASFRAKGGVLLDAGFGAVKWYGYFPRNPAAGLPEYRPLLLLNETSFGQPVAIINGDWITAVRTASISAVAAKFLAPPGATRIGFVGCGIQARSNLDALLPLFPLSHAIIHGRRPESAEAFAGFCATRGLSAEVTTDPRRAVGEAAIVVTTVPRLSSRTGFLDAAWTAPGSFVSMVDVGVSWSPTSLSAFTTRFTDEAQQSQFRATHGDAMDGTETPLANVVGGQHPGRTDPAARLALIFSGTGLADVAAAALVYDRAKTLGLGHILPL